MELRVSTVNYATDPRNDQRRVVLRFCVSRAKSKELFFSPEQYSGGDFWEVSVICFTGT